MWNRIKAKLSHTTRGISERFYGWFHGGESHEEALEELLLEADFGIQASEDLSSYVSKQHPKTLDDAKKMFKARLVELLKPYEHVLDFNLLVDNPQVVIFLGVNGAGKTTVLGKLAHRWQHLRVRCIAADTFRAGAQEQLEIWAQRGKADVTFAQQKDPGSVVYQGLQNAETHGNKLIFIDTAGRLPNRQDLMEELKKIYRVVKKFYGEKPYNLKVCLVLDGTTGQHMNTQVELFQKATPLSGLIMNKMDGTAKGGMLVALTQTFNLPIYGFGVGESLDDWYDFNASSFAEHILD